MFPQKNGMSPMFFFENSHHFKWFSQRHMHLVKGFGHSKPSTAVHNKSPHVPLVLLWTDPLNINHPMVGPPIWPIEKKESSVSNAGKTMPFLPPMTGNGKFIPPIKMMMTMFYPRLFILGMYHIHINLYGIIHIIHTIQMVMLEISFDPHLGICHRCFQPGQRQKTMDWRENILTGNLMLFTCYTTVYL